jgi:hypothetical protein
VGGRWMCIKLLALHGCTIIKVGVEMERMTAWHMHTQEPLLDARMYRFLL